MSAQLSPLPVQKFYDNNGIPLAYGLLTTYAAGTTNKQATYIDSTQTTQNTNPIQLNFRGECALWLDPTLNYKFLLQDAFGNTIPGYPVDNILGPLATQTQIGLIIYPRTPAEVSANVTPTNYIYPELDVRRYGADPTGAVDSTGAINSAIAVANAQGGGRVYLTAGIYVVGTSATINFVHNNIYFVGDGTAATGIINASSNQPAITIGNGITALFHCGIEKMYFTTKGGVTAVNGNCAIFLNNVSQTIIRDISVTSAQAAFYRGVFLQGCAEFWVYNLFVSGCLNDGITCVGTTDASMIECISNGNVGAGFVLNATQGGEWLSCSAFNNTGVGWAFISGAPASAPNFNNAFYDCVGDTSGSHNWLIQDSFDSWWVGCWGSTQQNIAVNTSACGFQIATQYCVNLRFSECTADNNNAHGFQLFDSGASAPQKIELIGCQYGSNDQLGSHGNGKAGSGYGLVITGVTSHIRVDGGMFDGNATAATNFSISGSFISQDIVVNGNPVGFVTCAEGTGTVATSTTSIAITHGLGFTPNLADIQITPTSSMAASSISAYWTSGPTSTQFTVNTNTAPVGASFNFVWRASFHGT